MQCIFIKKDNQQCKAYGMKDSNYCFRHNPKKAIEVMEASKSGGKNRSLTVCFNEEVSLETTSDIQRFLGKVINNVWQGKIPVKVGTSIGFLSRCWLDAYEKSELERRIEDLENKVKET
jgi:hypothetical protein